MALIPKFKTLANAIRDHGFGGVFPYVHSFLQKFRDKRDYERWIKQNSLTAEIRAELLLSIGKLDSRPLISIILPVYNVDEIWLRKCIDSVIAQIYPDWELCIADDASTRPHIRRVIEDYKQRDTRIKAVFRPNNGHISAASNSALELATGEFSVLLDHDDELTEDALYWVANELNEHPDAAMIYSDEDLIDEKGRRSDPKFKPDFSLDLLYSLNLVTHLSSYRTEVLRKIGGFRIGLEGSQDYDLALRVIEQIPASAIRHVPRILYHWRAIPTSVAGNSGAKPYAFAKAREAISSHFERTGTTATVDEVIGGLNRARYQLPDPLPVCSIIIIGGHTGAIVTETKYPALEMTMVGAAENISQSLNVAAASSSGEVLCFIDGSLEPLSTDWLREMVSLAIQPQIGAVGAKILRSDGGIDQTGFILGGKDLVRKAHFGLPSDRNGNLFRASLIGNYSAVSARCMVIRRSVFEEFRGFDAEHFAENFFDADLCLRLWEGGYRVVYTPYAELIEVRAGSRSAANDAEMEYFKSRWNEKLNRDPFYNPNFTDDGETFRYRI